MTQNSQPFDVAIIGGGIAGSGIARDALLRGMSVILFEKNTFGSGTSSKSSKLIHGGLRYLEVAWAALLGGNLAEFWKNFRFVFLELRETHTLHHLMPDLISPIELLLPIYIGGRRSRWAIYFGSFLYGLLSKLAGGSHSTKILWNRAEVLAKAPQLNPEGLLGGVIVWDHTTDDLKLVQSLIQDSLGRGLVAYEHAEVTHYHYHLAKKLYEITVSINGKSEMFYARKLINASGPWIDRVRENSNERRSDLMVPVAGSHITLKKFCEQSTILEANDGRLFFVINRKDRARVGTTERLYFNPDDVQPTAEEIHYLLDSIQKFFPGFHFTEKDILEKDAGIRPLAKPKNASLPNQISRDHEVTVGPTGVLHIVGVKLTDHRRAAEEIVNGFVKEIKKQKPEVRLKSLTSILPLAPQKVPPP